MTSALPERLRRELDDYPTPAWAIDAILPFLAIPDEGDILEPACGEGTIFARLEEVRHVPCYRMSGIDLHEPRVQEARLGGVDVRHGDALDPATPWGSPILIISNPPFRHAEAFCRRALREIAPGGTVAMLLRLAFLESAGRYAFHREHPVKGLHVFSSRPSFTGDGNTDSAAYAWFVWGPYQRGINVLPPHEAPRRARKTSSSSTETP